MSLDSLPDTLELTKKHRRPWKKLLWVKQDYDDNYTDHEFLSQLKRNSTVITYSYWKLFKDFSIISLHLSVIAVVLVVFYGIYALAWNPLTPTVTSTVLTTVGFIMYVTTLNMRRSRELIELQRLKIRQLSSRTPRKSASRSRSSSPFPESASTTTPEPDLESLLTTPTPPSFFSAFKSSSVILLYLLTFSPVLKSLTNSSASDSIWAISAWLCVLNMLFHDYTIDFPANPKSSSNFSKNIALSNAIVLASRLNSNLSAFCFILFSIQVCGLFPIFNNFVRSCGFWGFHWLQYGSIFLSASLFIHRIFGAGWLACWLALHLFIVVVCPLYFMALQKYKDELQGPWDPARPVINGVD